MSYRRTAALLCVVSTVAPAAAYEVVAVTDGGTLSGVVRYAGAPPPPRTVTITKDRAVCGDEKTQVDVAVGDGGGLRDVAVVVQDSRGKPLAAPGEVTFDQRACEYVPR